MKKSHKIAPILFGTLLPITIVPSIITIAAIGKRNKSEGFYYNDKYFANSSEFENHVKNEISQAMSYDERTIYYANNINKEFNSEADLNKFLYKNIKSHDVNLLKQNILYENDSNLPLTLDQLNEMDLNNLDYNTRAYLGINNVAYNNEKDAKLSYINSAQIYKFNNKYYANKETIINEIVLNYNRIKSTYSTENERINEFKRLYNLTDTDYKRFTAPNGSVSDINFQSANNEFNLDLLKQFISNNAKRYIKHNGNIYEVDEFVNNHFAKQDWKGSSIIKVKSTKGDKKYLVDIDKNDEANFYGDYILKSPSDEIRDFKNPSKWSKRKRNENVISSKDSIYKEIVNKFVSNLMMTVNNYLLEKKIKENPSQKEELLNKFHNNFSIFNFLPLIDEAEILKTHLKAFHINDNKHSNLWEKFDEIIKFMKNGKRGTFFNQLNVLYFSGLAYFAKDAASNTLVLLFKKYFKNLISKIDSYLSDALGDLYVDNQEKKLNLIEAYNLDDYSLDLDINNDFFISKLTNSDNVINAIGTINLAATNAMNSSSAIPFSDEDLLRKSSRNYDKLEKLYDKYSLRSKDKSNYIFDDNTGEYIKTEIYQDNNENIASNALQHYNYESAKAMNEYLRENFLNNLKDVDYSKLYTNNTLMKNYEFGFNYYKKVAIEFYKNSSSSLSKEKINGLKTLNFNNENDIQILQNEVKNIGKANLKKYINSKTITYNKLGFDSLLYKAQKAEILEKYTNGINGIKGAINTVGSISQLVFSIQSAGLNQTLNIVTSVQGLLSSVLGIFSSIPAVAIASAALDIVFTIITQLIGEKTQYDYVYSQTGNPNSHYIWDGGITTSKLWGFITKEDATITKAKLLDPIEFMPEFSTDYYYYNGKKYLDHQLSSLEKELFYNALENNDENFLKANNIEYCYSFEQTRNGDKSRYFSNLHDLITKLLSKVDNKQIMYLEEWYKSATGKINILGRIQNISNIQDAFEKLKDIVLHDLKAILLMQFPKLNDQKIPIDQINGKNNFDENQLGDLLSLVNNLNKDSKYEWLDKLLLFDGNLKDDKDAYVYDINNIKTLEQIFIKKFNVSSKLVSHKMLNENNEYDKLKEIIKTQIYSILNNENERVYFVSFKSAVKHLMQIQYLSITKKVIQENKTYKFKYQDKEFNTIEEVIEYCKKFIKSIEDYAKVKKGK
ncbi:hypothetical protein NPL4_03310 [Metamycoplasma hyosynoviae]|nr:hypothetical protein [Metamycoplasma hyosynoviae]KDE44974.1 hypothetical protein NPL4_03310 [Metamycoplasma hyosynoviae]